MIERDEVLRAGRPGLIDIVARVGDRRARIVAGLRRRGDEPHFLRSGEEAALGLLDDEDGLAVCTDAGPRRATGRPAARHGAGR